MIRRMDSSRLRAASHNEVQVQAAGNEGVLGAVCKGVSRDPRNMVGPDCVGQRILVVLVFQLLYFVFLMPSGILEKPGRVSPSPLGLSYLDLIFIDVHMARASWKYQPIAQTNCQLSTAAQGFPGPQVIRRTAWRCPGDGGSHAFSF